MSGRVLETELRRPQGRHATQKKRPSGYPPSLARYDVLDDYVEDPQALFKNISENLVNRVLKTDYEEPEEGDNTLSVLKRNRGEERWK